MSTIFKNDEIDSACNVFREYHYHFQNTKAVEKVREAFGLCQKYIQKAGISDSTTNALQRIRTVLNLNRQEFDHTPWNPPLHTYPFFEYLQNLILSMLQKVEQQTLTQETKVKIECFEAICLFIGIFNFKFIFDDKFLLALKQCLTDIRENQYLPDDFHYAVVASLFEQLYTVEKFKFKYYDIYQKLYPAVTTLILQCILKYYAKEFKRFYKDEQGRASRIDVDPKHRVFLNVFPEYLLSDEDLVRPTLTTQQLSTLCQTLFNLSQMVFHHIFKNEFSDYTLSNVLVRFLSLMNYCIPSVYFRRCTRQNLPLVEYLLRLLHVSFFIEDVTNFDPRFGIDVMERMVRKKHYALVVTAVALLYNLSVESCVADYLRTLKEKDKPPILYVLYNRSKKNNNHTTKFHCETLFGLMKNDIDNLEEPEELATSYVKYLSKTMNKQDYSFEKIRLSDIIIHLKVFIQNEGVKAEVVAQDGLRLLTICATEHRFDIASVQYPAMELIWSIIFNLSAAQILRDNKVFVDYAIDLTKSKPDQPDNHVLKSVAEGINWQLKQHIVKEEKRKAEKPMKLSVFGVPVDYMGRQITKEHRLAMEKSKEYKFDLMISYCHQDADLCIKIHKNLKDMTNARIWIDCEQMFGSFTERMSEAIENSRIILVCFSNAYKENANCQSECTYSNDLKRIIIPLRMESNYQPNGWLKAIIGGRLYIDFTKYDFRTAFKNLIRELQRYDKIYKETKRSQEPVNASASIAAVQSEKKAKEIRIPSPPPTSTSAQKVETQEPTVDADAFSSSTTCWNPEDQSTLNFSLAALYESKPIIDWTKEDVQSFFHNKHIEPMLDLLDTDAGGRDLLDYYQQLMTLEKPYELVKEELIEKHGILLPFRMFVTFDNELKIFSSKVK